MKRALSIINYFIDVCKAITKGLESVSDNWPANSPFNRPAIPDTKKENGILESVVDQKK